jgi:hypothetical protein
MLKLFPKDYYTEPLGYLIKSSRDEITIRFVGPVRNGLEMMTEYPFSSVPEDALQYIITWLDNRIKEQTFAKNVISKSN